MGGIKKAQGHSPDPEDRSGQAVEPDFNGDMDWLRNGAPSPDEDAVINIGMYCHRNNRINHLIFENKHPIFI